MEMTPCADGKDCDGPVDAGQLCSRHRAIYDGLVDDVDPADPSRVEEIDHG